MSPGTFDPIQQKHRNNSLGASSLLRRFVIKPHSLRVITIQNRRRVYITYVQPDFTLTDMTSSSMASWTKLLPFLPYGNDAISPPAMVAIP